MNLKNMRKKRQNVWVSYGQEVPPQDRNYSNEYKNNFHWKKPSVLFIKRMKKVMKSNNCNTKYDLWENVSTCSVAMAENGNITRRNEEAMLMTWGDWSR